MKKIGWIGLLLLFVALAVPAAAEDGAAHVHNVQSWSPVGTGHSGVCVDCGEAVTGSHSYGKWTIGNASQHQHSCTLCGATENAAHNWNSGEVTQWPFCTWEGVRTYTCRDCGRQKTQTIAMLAHLYDNGCDIDCNRCGALRRTKHQYEKQWKSDENEHWYTCTVCGDKVDLDVHFPGQWILDKEAGEYEDGQQHKACMVCERVLQTEVIPATGCLHGNEELRGALEPTCTEEGYTGDWCCPRCDAVVQEGEPIPMLPHDTEIENLKEATCTEEGYTGDEVCQLCMGVIVEGETLEKLPHDTEMENKKEATCTEEGYTGDEICRLCMGVIVEGETLEKLPHDTEMENQKEASCAEEGYTGDEICQLCRGVITEGQVMEKLPHEPALKNEKQASCTEEGYTGDQICAKCEAVVEQGSRIPTKAHRCENGMCLDCGADESDNVMPTVPSGDMESEEDGRDEKMSPFVIICIVVMCVASGGMVMVLYLLLKKK